MHRSLPAASNRTSPSSAVVTAAARREPPSREAKVRNRLGIKQITLKNRLDAVHPGSGTALTESAYPVGPPKGH